MNAFFSKTVTAKPAFARRAAAETPPMPAPSSRQLELRGKSCREMLRELCKPITMAVGFSPGDLVSTMLSGVSCQALRDTWA